MSMASKTGISMGWGKAVFLSFDSWGVLFSFVLSGYALFSHLGDMPLIAPDEGRNAEVAREMYQSHAWLVPTYDGLTYLDKPAFYFKTVALSFSLLGESEGVARLSSATFGYALLVALFLFCRRVYDQRTATLAMLIVASTPLYMAFSRIVIFDMTLAFFVCAAIFLCYLAEESEGKAQKSWYLAGALASGIATLIKGPVGFIIPTLVVVLANRIEGRDGAQKRCFAPINWAVFFAVVLPWFIGLSAICPDFPYYGIVKESVSRFTTTEFHRTAPFYFYALIIASCFFAWSLLLPESILAAWRSRKRWSRADRLFVIWAIVVVVFFSISKSKLPGYILTAVIALGILTARLFAKSMDDHQGKAAQIVQHGTLILLLLSATAALLMEGAILSPQTAGHLLNLKPEIFAALISNLPSVTLSVVCIAALATLARWTRDPRLAFFAFLSVPLLLLTAHFDIVTNYAESRSTRTLAERIPATLPPDTELACYKCLPNGLPFYLKRLVTVLSDDGSELTSNYVLFTLSTNAARPDRIVPLSESEHWLATREHPVYLLAKERHLDILRATAANDRVEVTELGNGYWAALLPPHQAQR